MAVVDLNAPIDRQTLLQAVAARLRELIVEGVLAPGQRLNERELCERLGVSRTPLREALRALAGEGLVSQEPNRGASVATLSRAEIEQAFETIGALEALAGELACARRSDAEVAEIRRLHEEMARHHAARDLPAYYRVNREIHGRIMAAARNAVLAETYGQLNARLHALRFRSNLKRAKWDDALAEHAAMVDALERRDGPRLGAILRRHLENKRDAVLSEMEAAA